MDNNYSSTDPVFDPDLSLPHFDEDVTLLSARPVVPLHEVKSETLSRRRVIFGLTILAAILLGAISATLLLMQSGQNPESVAEPEVVQPAESAAGGSTAESAEARMPIARAPLEDSPAKEVSSERDFSTKKRPTEPVLRGSIKPARAGSPGRERDEDFENDERELRRSDRRNARREARRERRDRREQRGDDLLRIREIFEGSPRP
ncbi:MAG: hypothetical protein ABR568_00455 [Pyrinomonadaceae bacterium]